MNNKSINVDQIASAFDEILSRIQEDTLLNECGEAAIKVARKYKRPVQSEAKLKIKHSKSKGGNTPYISTFVAKELKDMHGKYGATIWNSNYRLSHLVEAPHLMWNTKDSSSNDYNMFKDNNTPACTEFKRECIKIVLNAMKGK